MESNRHKWDGPRGVARTSNGGGYAVTCKKCGCVRQFVAGYPTYFIDDRVYDKKAPKCDNRLLTPSTKQHDQSEI